MRDYDSAAIRKLADLLCTIATFTQVLFGVAGVVTALTIGAVGLETGKFASFIAIAGLIDGFAISAVGYVIALVIKAFAHLILAIVQIETNTARSASIHVSADRERGVSPVSTATSVTPAAESQDAAASRRSVPRRVQELYEEARDTYEELSGLDDDAFFEMERKQALRDRVLALFDAIATECERQDPGVAAAVARRARNDFPQLLADSGFVAVIDDLEQAV